jgi:hypothetical protein
MGYLELCRIVDQHEFVHSNLYACQFFNRRRYELVAIDPHHLPGQYRCFNSDDIKWTCRGKIWHTLSGFCKSKFWNHRCQYPCHAAGDRRLWMVWYPVTR